MTERVATSERGESGSVPTDGTKISPLPALDRRAVIGGLATLAAMPGAAAAQAPPTDPAFIAVGDWGRRGASPQREVAVAMGHAARQIDSRFVVAVGDNFYPAGVASVKDSHWKESFEDVYTAPGLQTPWYVALGNHDYRGNARAQIHYSNHSDRWRMPARYFKAPEAVTGIPGLDLFFLDTTPIVGTEHEEVLQWLNGRPPRKHRRSRQLVWLEHELAHSTAPWKVVVGHHPIYSGSHGDSAELLATVQPLLETYGVQAYINGHDHDLQHIRRGRTDYICAGAGSDARKVAAIDGTQFCIGRPGFATFVLRPDVLELGFRDLNGARLYDASLPRVRA